MKAYVLHGIGDLRYEEREIPKPKVGEVLLRIEAAGICGSDIPRIYDTGAHVHPIIPGHEFAGTVVKSADSSLFGKRMGVFPLIPCKRCDMCRQKKYELCQHYNYLGSRCDGGFAEYVCVPAWNLIELPDKVPFEQAACLEPLAVAVHAVRRVAVTANDAVAVIGMGTIGMLVTIVLLANGVRNITAVVNKEFQRNVALKFGVSVKNFSEFEQAGASNSVIFECVGRPETAVSAIESTVPGGRIMLVGNPRSDMTFPQNIYWKILRNQLHVLGTWNSSFTTDAQDDWHNAIRLLQEKQTNVSSIITHRFPIDELKTGLHIMRNKTVGYGKILMVR